MRADSIKLSHLSPSLSRRNSGVTVDGNVFFSFFLGLREFTSALRHLKLVSIFGDAYDKSIPRGYPKQPCKTPVNSREKKMEKYLWKRRGNAKGPNKFSKGIYRRKQAGKRFHCLLPIYGAGIFRCLSLVHTHVQKNEIEIFFLFFRVFQEYFPPHLIWRGGNKHIDFAVLRKSGEKQEQTLFNDLRRRI